jgi:hypothetical protein
VQECVNVYVRLCMCASVLVRFCVLVYLGVRAKGSVCTFVLVRVIANAYVSATTTVQQPTVVRCQSRRYYRAACALPTSTLNSLVHNEDAPHGT